MKPENIQKILSSTTSYPSKWELDNIVWLERVSNPKTLIDFLSRIQFLQSNAKSDSENRELDILLDLLERMDEDDCIGLLSQTENQEKENFIENLARTSAIEVITRGCLTFETLDTSCKLSPNDFILCAKRTQDILNAIQGLVIKGETLSKDVAGA